jgi:hypothetical protein
LVTPLLPALLFFCKRDKSLHDVNSKSFPARIVPR